MVAQNYVLRSVYLEPEIDDYLREQAFHLRVSKNDLIRRYLLSGAKQELEFAMKAPINSKSRRSLSTGVLRAAASADLIPVGALSDAPAADGVSPRSARGSVAAMIASARQNGTQKTVSTHSAKKQSGSVRKSAPSGAKKAAKKASKKAAK